jgi:hypothetical protein
LFSGFPKIASPNLFLYFYPRFLEMPLSYSSVYVRLERNGTLVNSYHVSNTGSFKFNVYSGKMTGENSTYRVGIKGKYDNIEYWSNEFIVKNPGIIPIGYDNDKSNCNYAVF